MIRSAATTTALSRVAARNTQRKFLSSAPALVDLANNIRRSSLPSGSALCRVATTTSARDRGLWKRSYASTPAIPASKTVSITYIEADGTSKTVDAEVGADLMTVAHDNEIELEGACGGELACSTCHLVFDPDVYETLPEKEDEEDDMLDLAFEVTDTSRLGCQIPVQESFDGMTVQIPDDGF
mmetsp:Transcript_26092/g.55914  ORF Transcript_26092/g.55914 Transcript_26092/m.55914 type:complete len:183 (+) Transcript_26092:343-891(+)|eukprot:CAMPEP_0201135594 /NCGR_PEP_ID=MMETSP0850-20130426/54405_1 /ASSEMBLY_ACC=CAM_ASM_000622 /TAXON_ID=183588 /ORGANISM="Pseudo-nitzschia fraudulenta, Strain WWA7" /LENGTH=182 /DNA_ID=CAMNT_0047406781 /DNA_START=281 /DNA_END=829 /DNA_ORIENTATION=+